MDHGTVADATINNENGRYEEWKWKLAVIVTASFLGIAFACETLMSWAHSRQTNKDLRVSTDDD